MTDSAQAGRPLHHFTRPGLTFDVQDRGRADGVPVVLLHGWPATAACWDQVVDKLVDHGLRTLAPNQRGYSPGARPRGRRSYVMSELVADVVALIDDAGLGRVHLVGHDWGGAVAWAVAATHPDRLATLTVLSTPHPQAMQRALLSSTQLLKSLYVLFFQIPVLPEALLLARNGAVGRRLLRRSGLPADRAAAYMAHQGEPGAMSAALAWYRALPFEFRRTSQIGSISVPTLYVWSDGDVALTRRAAELTRSCVTGPYRFEVLEGVSHWIPEEVPGRAAELIISTVAAMVADIPVAHTPSGGYGHTMPDPILGDWREPLASGAPDLRGTWSVISVEVGEHHAPDDHPIRGHVERVEQGGDRVVITAGGVVHDMRADGTVEHGVNDVAAIDFSTPIQVVATFEEAVLVLRPVGMPGVEVRRWREGDDLVWDYAGAFRARMKPL